MCDLDLSPYLSIGEHAVGAQRTLASMKQEPNKRLPLRSRLLPSMWFLWMGVLTWLAVWAKAVTEETKALRQEGSSLGSLS